MQIKNSLLITLGHNSSAILVYDNGTKIIGYEQERIDGIKSSSAFPSGAIFKIAEVLGLKYLKTCKVYISHWFDCEKSGYKFKPSKYMKQSDMDNLCSFTDESNITFCDSLDTHHDAHACSALAFFKYHAHNGFVHKVGEHIKGEDIHVIVADGFGTNGEVLSIYKTKLDFTSLELVNSVRNYPASFGLMYQYATSFTGMKENQDEYKYLGYEAHIGEYCNEEEIDRLDHYIESTVEHLKNARLNKNGYTSNGHDLINFDNLNVVKNWWHSWFEEVLTSSCDTDILFDSFKARVMIAYLIQQSLEISMRHILDEYDIKNCIVVGGVFYNVKLNNKILTHIPGIFCAAPLAGDQGAAIGMFYIDTVNKYPNYDFPFKSLCIGERSLYGIEKFRIPNMKYVLADSDAKRFDIIKEIATHISNNGIVNIVSGPMEFGPRALCNTSTLMLPTQELVGINNYLNNRNEVMPCAPVMLKRTAEITFDKAELDRVIGSDNFMICTHDYKTIYSNCMAGVMHKKPLEFVYTGRPQIVSDDSFIGQILAKVHDICGESVLVNTSFNAHGRPIAFETMDIIHNFNYQTSRIQSQMTKDLDFFKLYIINIE